MGGRVSELMTVLSAGAERAEIERASVFSTIVRRAKSPCAKRKRKRVHLQQSAEVMDD